MFLMSGYPTTTKRRPTGRKLSDLNSIKVKQKFLKHLQSGSIKLDRKKLLDLNILWSRMHIISFSFVEFTKHLNKI